MEFSWSIETFKTLPSTQDLVKERAQNEGAASGLVIHADQQSAGRGRHGRSWIGQDGNLFFSFLLRPSFGVSAVGQLSLLVGVAIAQGMIALCGHQLREDLKLKWPNDILLAGRKCAGILLETQLSEDAQSFDWVAIGIGVNIISAAQEEWSCLSEYAPDLAPTILRDEILARFSVLYDLWQAQGFDAIKALWLDLSFEEGSDVTVRLGERKICATFAGVNDDGGLLLHENGAIRTITAGDVYM